MASFRAALRQAPRTQSLLARPLTGTAAPFTRRAFATTVRRSADDAEKHDIPELAEAEAMAEGGDDPHMNGNFPDPSLTSALPIKRQFRDPYADWWDPIERRNYGEPVHEDNDILGVFSTEEYTHFSPGWGAVLMGCFVATVGVLCAVVGRVYPDTPAVPRTFPGGLETELGGPRAVRARMEWDEESVL